jgi:hypothetical protein
MSAEWPRGRTEPVIQDINKSELGQSVKASVSERPKMTSLEKEHLEARLIALGQLLGNSHVWWQVDGSLVLSLRKKEKGEDYIGVHSDIDVSVRRDELPALESYLKEHGYALFLQSKEGENRSFRRIGNGNFTRRMVGDTRETPYIAAIDEHGSIRTDTELVRMQVSVIDTDAEGNPSERGLSYPKEWLEGSVTDLNGTPLPLSHPARHLLFKIWYTREYDEKDIEVWAEMHALSTQDMDTLEHIVLSAAADPEWWEQNKSFKKDIEALRHRLVYLRDTTERDVSA